MSSSILITFAGRKERMSLMADYAQEAIRRGIIDEWHVWDFSRTPEDHEWISRSFGAIRFQSSEAPYQEFAALEKDVPLRFSARIPNDLHIGFTSQEPSHAFHELVIGGWSNSHCAFRLLPQTMFQTFDRGMEHNGWMRSTPGILTPHEPNEIVLLLHSHGDLTAKVNGVEIGRWNISALGDRPKIFLRGGWGGSLEITSTNGQIQRFIGAPGMRMPYTQAYDFYAKRSKQYADCVFLKCDDDIVYMDLDKLPDFIAERRKNLEPLILSANVVNNGVCAHFQQLGGALPPDRLGYFENPPGGHEGTLWQSGERATALHDFFLSTADKSLRLPQAIVSYDGRISINFIAWLGRDLIHLALPPGDDEKFISVDIPKMLNRSVALYSDFVVSHLSFGVQDKHMPIARLIEAYRHYAPTTVQSLDFEASQI